MYIPYFDGLVERASDDLVPPIMGPIDTVDLGGVSLDIGNRQRAFLQDKSVSENV